MAVNEAIPFYEPGERISAHADAAIIGKRFVKISADKQPGSTLTPAGADQTSGGNIRTVQAVAGDRALGVSSHDCPAGGKYTVLASPGMVVPVRAGAAVTAGQQVQSNANGEAITLAAGVALGLALASAASGADVPVALGK